VIVEKFHWSRNIGRFLDVRTGEPRVGGVSFSGTVREWYETIRDVITIADLECGPIHWIRVNRDVLTILECCLDYRPNFAMIGGQAWGYLKVNHRSDAPASQLSERGREVPVFLDTTIMRNAISLQKYEDENVPYVVIPAMVKVHDLNLI
jgi:hypothetical protein